MGSISRRSQQRETGLKARMGGKREKARSLEAENKELGARIDAMGKNEGVRNGPGISFEEEEENLEEVWRDCMEVEDEEECRRKLDEKRKKIMKELREVERLSFASKEVQENLMESMQHQLQEVKEVTKDTKRPRQ